MNGDIAPFNPWIGLLCPVPCIGIFICKSHALPNCLAIALFVFLAFLPMQEIKHISVITNFEKVGENQKQTMSRCKIAPYTENMFAISFENSLKSLRVLSEKRLKILSGR